jgi:hypothetical protein
VLRCGGGKALTKQAADENPFKFHLPVEEVNKAGEVDALVVCDVHVNAELEEKNEMSPISNEIKPKGVLETAMPNLYNLENDVEVEKPMKIDLDLDLYQMEKV